MSEADIYWLGQNDGWPIGKYFLLPFGKVIKKRELKKESKKESWEAQKSLIQFIYHRFCERLPGVGREIKDTRPPSTTTTTTTTTTNCQKPQFLRPS